MSIPAALVAIAAAADVRFDGDRPWDLQVHDARFYRDVLHGGSLALGQGYVRGSWDCQQLDELICRLLRVDANRPLSLPWRCQEWIGLLRDRLLNPQGLLRAFVVGLCHYDIDPRIYAAMLGPQMAYSCGYWRTAHDLPAAQEDKLRLICEKLQLRPGMRLLDVGCGWGALAAFAARHYGAEVLGITVSAEQVRWIRERCSGLPIQVELCDYRQLPAIDPGGFDRIASVGMFEHVGRRNDPLFFRVLPVYTSVAEACALIRRTPPRLLVLDLDPLPQGYRDAIDLLRQGHPEAELLVLTAPDQPFSPPCGSGGDHGRRCGSGPELGAAAPGDRAADAP